MIIPPAKAISSSDHAQWRQIKIERLTHELALHKRHRFGVKAEAAAVAAAHGMSMAALLRELLARVAARDAETLAWLDKARR